MDLLQNALFNNYGISKVCEAHSLILLFSIMSLRANLNPIHPFALIS